MRAFAAVPFAEPGRPITVGTGATHVQLAITVSGQLLTVTAVPATLLLMARITDQRVPVLVVLWGRALMESSSAGQSMELAVGCGSQLRRGRPTNRGAAPRSGCSPRCAATAAGHPAAAGRHGPACGGAPAGGACRPVNGHRHRRAQWRRATGGRCDGVCQSAAGPHRRAALCPP